MTTYTYTIIAPPGSIMSMSAESINDLGQMRYVYQQQRRLHRLSSTATASTQQSFRQVRSEATFRLNNSGQISGRRFVNVPRN